MSAGKPDSLLESERRIRLALFSASPTVVITVVTLQGETLVIIEQSSVMFLFYPYWGLRKILPNITSALWKLAALQQQCFSSQVHKLFCRLFCPK